MSRLTSPVFVGREPELELLNDVMRSGSDGASVVLVAGDAGIGKTRLVTEFAARAESEGAAILAGECLEFSGAALPYAPIAAAVERFGRSTLSGDLSDTVTEIVGFLSGRAPSLGVGLDERAGRAAFFHSFADFIMRLAQLRPTVLIVEDLHWSDESTRDLLTFLLRILDGPITVVLTYRLDELHRRHPLKRWIAQESRDARVSRIELRPLDRACTTAQLTGIMGTRPSALVADAIFERAEGNPFYAEEFAAAYPDGPRQVPTTLRETLLARVDRLSPETQDVLRWASVIGRAFAYGTLVELTQKSDEAILVALREAVEFNILTTDPSDKYTFRHALLRESIYGELLPGEAARVHQRIAAVLQDAGDDGSGNHIRVAEVAHHLIAGHQDAAALRASVEAGLAADAVFAFPEARKHFENALDLWGRVPGPTTTSPIPHADLLGRTAETAYLSGDPRRAVALVRLALDETPETDRGRRAALLTRLGLFQRRGLGEDDASQESLTRAAELLEDHEPSLEKATALAELAYGLVMRGRGDEARPHAYAALTMAESLGADGVRSTAHSALAIARDAVTEVEEAIGDANEAVALAEGDSERLATGLRVLTDLLFRGGRSHEAVATALKGSERLERLGLYHTDAAFLLASAGDRLMETGRFEEAAAVLDDVLTRDCDLTARIYAMNMRGRLYAFIGAFDKARELFAESETLSGTLLQPQFVGDMRTIAAEFAVLERRYDDARRLVEEGLEATVTTDPWMAVQVCAAGMMAEGDRAEDPAAPSRGGGHEAADHLMEVLHTLATSHDVPTIAAHVATCEAEYGRVLGRSEPDAWHAAALAWSAVDSRFRYALALLREGNALLTGRGSRKRAETSLAAAWQMASEMGAEPLKEQTARLARHAGIDLTPISPDEAAPAPLDTRGLTKREVEVLHHVAAGLTNKEIASTLFISEKTASVHVSNILMKLGVRSRVEAATAAYRLGIVTDDAPRPS